MELDTYSAYVQSMTIVDKLIFKEVVSTKWNEIARPTLNNDLRLEL